MIVSVYDRSAGVQRRAVTDSERLVRRFFSEAINGHDLDLFDELCSQDYIWHGGSDPGAIGDVHGLERFKAAVATFFTAFPDLEATILDLSLIHISEPTRL